MISMRECEQRWLKFWVYPKNPMYSAESILIFILPSLFAKNADFSESIPMGPNVESPAVVMGCRGPNRAYLDCIGGDYVKVYDIGFCERCKEKWIRARV